MRVLVAAKYFKYSAEQGRYTDEEEDISWINDLQGIDWAYVYNNARQVLEYLNTEHAHWTTNADIKNVGREQGAYTRFIYDNYEWIVQRDHTLIFTQGNPFYHTGGFIDIVNAISEDTMKSAGYLGLSEDGVRNSFISGVKYELKRCFGIEVPDVMKVTGNGMFMVHSSRIAHYPRESWRKFMETMTTSKLSLQVYTGESTWNHLLGEHFEHANCHCSTL